MPSILEELPVKAAKVIGKGFRFCRRKLEEYNAKMLEKEKQRRWAAFLEQTQYELMKLVKEQIKADQFAYTTRPVFEKQEIVHNNQSKSVQMVHVADEIVPICYDSGDFQADCIVFSFTIFGELDSDILLKMKEKWVYYMKINGLYGIADTYKKDDLRRLTFIIYEKRNERAVKGDLFRLKNP
ncbi:hypothetical protein [Streptococcus anginosus]|uniref:hypothetical protein n=1 Tax=Streptococcus anginosus TaxID=1328 RepID=UPI000D0883E3|nr:hypothetical protein [Streptococcus anginosus]PRT67323.1 hypothetical protein C6A29_03770 [Streptococcus anginosus]PRT73484.1 hypothetical protein C6A31_10385 [Streptococcus anginosus]